MASRIQPRREEPQRDLEMKKAAHFLQRRITKGGKKVSMLKRLRIFRRAITYKHFRTRKRQEFKERLDILWAVANLEADANPTSMIWKELSQLSKQLASDQVRSEVMEKRATEFAARSIALLLLLFLIWLCVPISIFGFPRVQTYPFPKSM